MSPLDDNKRVDLLGDELAEALDDDDNDVSVCAGLSSGKPNKPIDSASTNVTEPSIAFMQMLSQ